PRTAARERRTAATGRVLEGDARSGGDSDRATRSRSRGPSRREPQPPRATLRSKERDGFVPGPLESSRRREGAGPFHAAEAGPAEGSARSETAGLRPLARGRGIPRVARRAAGLPAVRRGAGAQRHRGFRTDRDRGPSVSPTHPAATLPADMP